MKFSLVREHSLLPRPRYSITRRINEYTITDYFCAALVHFKIGILSIRCSFLFYVNIVGVAGIECKIMGYYFVICSILFAICSVSAECSQEQTTEDCGCSATSRQSSAVTSDDRSEDTPTESATPPRVSGQDETRTNEMVLIEGETFVMGSDKPIIMADGEGPARHVTVNTFWMDVHEVSNAEFKKFIDATGYVTEVSDYSMFMLSAVPLIDK